VLHSELSHQLAVTHNVPSVITPVRVKVSKQASKPVSE